MSYINLRKRRAPVRTRRRGLSGLGANLLPCPPYAPPGTTGCISVSSQTGFGPGVTTSAGTRYSSLNLDATGYLAQMLGAGQTSMSVPNYALSTAEQVAYNNTRNALNPALVGVFQAGNYPFMSLPGGYVAAWGSSNRTLKIYKMGKDILEASTSLVNDVINEIRKLACGITDNALITAAIKASPSGAPASAIAQRLCAAKNQDAPFIPPPPVPSSGIGGVAILGAAAAAAYFILHR